MKTLFISHGSPDEILHDTSHRRQWRELSRRFEAFDALVVMSAHNETTGTVVGANPAPHTIPDFGPSFPDTLFRKQYPASGDPALAARVANRLRDAGLAPQEDRRAGLDHGVWAPLSQILPEADLPIVTVSADPRRDAGHHLAVGRALAGMDERILLIGSGASTHNLQAVRWGERDAAPNPRAEIFARWLEERLAAGDEEALLDFGSAPQGAFNHPTPEHIMPLFFAMGAAGPGWRAHLLHRGFSLGALAMHVIAFDDPASR
ncbi:MAG: class III extradiol ring-cleavage dioxygenase [Xanthomonadales bacterium]|nr:class III extradiol ring-cleavage dioxygenase [Xanthomonadales bacterium]